ncbi:FAD binding domain-containing protein [Sphaerochaeta sp. PS]|uniref:FAD binding domain-containing protein n=1 Tax=Sphaerochaeta sp. PS TaxID=3076336 RepID=UPI0028A3AAA7|nr:FAD binding domain-containing protein [Sphaerochaeta sp. PS]MDT4763415.1 FAD binding domain-containing protein [Sphaerochaeta sp. PS]
MIQEFLIAKDTEDALKLKRNNPKSVFYAGGTEINRLNSTVDAKTAISLAKLGLDTITDEGNSIRIGSMVTFQQLIESALVPQWLKQAASFCGSFTKRNMATLGGNLAMCSDHSYLGPALLASRARVLTANLTEAGSYNEDNIPIREYHAYHTQFSGTLLLGVSLSKDARFVGSLRYANTVQSQAAVTVGFGATKNGEGVIDHVRVFAAVKGIGMQRLSAVENAIENGELTTKQDVQLAVGHAIEAKDDSTGTSSYKRYIASEGISQLFSNFISGGVK